MASPAKASSVAVGVAGFELPVSVEPRQCFTAGRARVGSPWNDGRCFMASRRCSFVTFRAVGLRFACSVRRSRSLCAAGKGTGSTVTTRRGHSGPPTAAGGFVCCGGGRCRRLSICSAPCRLAGRLIVRRGWRLKSRARSPVSTLQMALERPRLGEPLTTVDRWAATLCCG
jgi:hypothetical protein